MRSLVGLVVLVVGASGARAEANRERAQTLYDRGVEAVKRGQEQRALERFEAAIAADPGFRAPYDAAIPLWVQLDRLPDLIKHLEFATDHIADYASAWYALAHAYRQSRRFARAVAAYELYLRLRPRDPDGYYGLGVALIGLENRPRAINELRTYLSLERRPERARWVTDASERLAALDAPIPPGIGGPTAADELARAKVLIDEMRYASALSILGRLAPADQAGRGQLWLLRARAHLGAGRSDAAIAAGFVALGLRAGDAAVLDALADAFAAAGRGGVAAYLRKIAE